jgi:probable HAF family extracellular repeat protein
MYKPVTPFATIRRTLPAALLIAAMVPCNVVALPEYSIVDLGVLADDTSSDGYQINSSGQVLAVSRGSTTGTRAVRYTEGSELQDLGKVDGILDAFTTIGINDTGQIATTRNRGAARYTEGPGWVELGVLPGGASSFGHDINNRGQVAGYSSTGTGGFRAFRYTDGQGLVDLGLLSGDESSLALGINRRGDVVGISYRTTVQQSTAFLYTNAGGMQALGSLGGNLTTALRLNKKRQIVGWAYTPNSFKHAFRYTPAGGISDLGVLPGDKRSEAAEINDQGQVVGISYRTLHSPRHPFLWEAGVGLQDLNGAPSIHAAGWILETAAGINNSSQIVGSGTNPEGKHHAYRLTPIGPGDQYQCFGHTATRVGTPGDDVIDGTDGDDVIMGLGGNDIINGGAGNDFICGGPGRDRLNGQDGNDTLVGGNGKDRVNGGDGSDICVQGERVAACEL